MPNGRQPATDFTLTAIDGESATFENPAHEFPGRSDICAGRTVRWKRLSVATPISVRRPSLFAGGPRNELSQRPDSEAHPLKQVLETRLGSKCFQVRPGLNVWHS